MNEKRDANGFELQDIWIALSFLSRLPVSLDPDKAQDRGAAACWAYPVAGAIIGLIAGFVGWGLMSAGLAPALSAGLALTVLIALSGALHEDGLADFTDGFWGGKDEETRLSIMRDSRIGVYGTLVLILFVGLRWQALAHMQAWHILSAMVLAGAISRAPLPWIMATYPAARANGLSTLIGQPKPETVNAGILAGALVSALAFGMTGLLLFLAGGLVAILFMQYVQTKIAGQTGDILGACQQVVELSVLILVTAMI